jgi:protein involved in polysaccharide export with SLBB domain
MINTRRITLATIVALALGINVVAQTQNDPQKARPRTTTSASDQEKDKTQAPLVSGDAVASSSTAQANGQDDQTSDEAAAINPYYKNFFSTYRLGPEDIISVDVFNQPRYSRGNIIVPPSGRVSLSLIKGGVFVNGKTVDEVAEIIKKRYDEYIIDPQVTVSLDKAMSYRYSVIGDVGQPGIRLMSKRLTVSEAIAEAGGVLNTGNKSKIVVLRRQQTGVLAQIPVNLSAIYKGKAADTVYLEPGDQIIVPGNTLKKIQTIMSLTPIASFARVFGAPVP